MGDRSGWEHVRIGSPQKGDRPGWRDVGMRTHQDDHTSKLGTSQDGDILIELASA